MLRGAKNLNFTFCGYLFRKKVSSGGGGELVWEKASVHTVAKAWFAYAFILHVLILVLSRVIIKVPSPTPASTPLKDFLYLFLSSLDLSPHQIEH